MRCGVVRMKLVIACFALAALSCAAFASSPDVEPRQLESVGIRTLTGRHLVLHTDVPSDPEVDRLPALFAEAVPQWADYFGVDQAKTATWRARAYLIADRRRFDALGLMPVGNDQFVNGISLGDELWLYEQPSAYYRRHLLLHEGTHAFMSRFLGGCGPGWYMEGTAELLATHRLDDKQTPTLTLRTVPRDRSEVPMLGRIKLVREAVAERRALDFPAVLQIDNRQQLGNEAYAWCWSAAVFLDSHPRYQQRFRQLKAHVRNTEFNDIVRRMYAADWADLLAEWQAFVATLDYGYDFQRMAIEFRAGQPVEGRTHRTTIVADRGWQSSGAWLEAGKTYRISANGRYKIAEEADDGKVRPWPCEPGGVTIEYHEGRPLGMLLGAIDARRPGATLADSFGIGLGTSVTPTASGTLYLRVNDWPARLDDNRGTLNIVIEPVRAVSREAPPLTR